MPTIENLNVGLSLNAAGFLGGISKVTGSLGKFGLAVQGVKAILGLLEAPFQLVLGQLQKMDVIGDLASNIGIDPAALTRLQYAAKQTDSSIDALNTALKRAALTRPGKTFEELADEIRNAGDAMDRAALSRKIFGRGVVEINALLQLSREELAALGKESDRIGNTLTKTMVDKANQAANAAQRLDDAWEGFKNLVVIELEPALTALLDTLGEIIIAMRKLSDSAAMQEFRGFINTQKKGLLEIQLIIAEITGDIERQNMLLKQIASVGHEEPEAKRRRKADEIPIGLAGHAVDVGAATRFTAAGFSAAQQGREMAKLIDVARQQLAEQKKANQKLDGIGKKLEPAPIGEDL